MLFRSVSQSRYDVSQSRYQFAQYFFEPEIVNYSLDSIEMCRYVHRVYTELLLSKHFLYYVCDRPTLSERKRKLKLIEEFYSRLDYMHLKTFFENQQLFYESDLIGDLDLMSDAWENSYYPFFMTMFTLALMFIRKLLYIDCMICK